tara:strand:- start:1355 stop:1561 length:207 start_codon:yes stop_codon:yes gene_type:complete
MTYSNNFNLYVALPFTHLLHHLHLLVSQCLVRQQLAREVELALASQLDQVDHFKLLEHQLGYSLQFHV